MKNYKKMLIGFAGLVFLPAIAMAVPTKHDKCGINVKEPKNSSGYFFSKDCKTVYVMPPRVGSLRISNYRPTGFQQKRCERIESIENESGYYASVKENLAKQVAANAEKIGMYQEAQSTGLYPVGMDENEVRREILKLLKENREIREELKYFDESYVEEMQSFAQREGAWADFIIEDEYSDLLTKFRKKNGGDLSFRRMVIDQNMVSITDREFDADIQKLQMSAVLELTIAGQPTPMSQGAANLLSDTVVEITEGDAKKDIFGSALSGSMRLSDIGACIKNDVIPGIDSFSMKDLEVYVSPNAFYEYQVQVERKYAVTYNLKELVKRIHSQTKKGGFFSKKTINRLVDTRKTESWITFHAESNDVRFEYSDEDIKEIKKDFIDRALRQIIAAKVGSEAGALALIAPTGKNGAQQLGDQLQKCPHLYCQIGAAGMKVLDSIFGSEKATAEIVKQFNGSASEVVTENKMVRQYGSMTFE